MNSYKSGNLKTFTVVYPALGGVAQISVTVQAASPDRAIAVASDAVARSARQTPTV